MADELFNRISISGARVSQLAGVRRKLDSMSPESLRDTDAVVASLCKEFDLQAPELNLSAVKPEIVQEYHRLSHEEAFLRDMEPSQEVKTDVARFRIPFTGEQAMFEVQPQPYGQNPPSAT